MAHLTKALELEQRDPQIHYLYGKALFELKDNEGALASLQEASRIDPYMSEPHYLMAQVYMKMGNRESAQKELELFKKVKKPK